MENNVQQNSSPAVNECRKNSDARTFWIALLTSVIVVAVYHFGGGLYKIWSGNYEEDGFSSGCRKQKKMCRMVPVMCPVMMQHCPAMHRMCPMQQKQNGEMMRPRRDMAGKRAMFRKGSERHHGGHHGAGRHFRRPAPGKMAPGNGPEAPEAK